MFDVYFSDKNKLYRKKDIEFDHRTWKDFCSSLTTVAYRIATMRTSVNVTW